MNEGKILIYGNIGDAAGYAMRGGKIYVEGNAGYRAGIHMKLIKKKFLLWSSADVQEAFWVNTRPAVSLSFSGSTKTAETLSAISMYRYAWRENVPARKLQEHTLSEQVTAKCAAPEELEEIQEYLSEYCSDFGYSFSELLSEPFTIITPDSKNPYKQMYVAN